MRRHPSKSLLESQKQIWKQNSATSYIASQDIRLTKAVGHWHSIKTKGIDASYQHPRAFLS